MRKPRSAAWPLPVAALFVALLAFASAPAWAGAAAGAGNIAGAESASAARNIAGAAAAGDARVAELARSREWQVLLHERAGWLGGMRSEADGPGFFLSPAGKDDGEAELRADLAAFRAGEGARADPGRSAAPGTREDVAVGAGVSAGAADASPGGEGQPAGCRFPARLKFLRENLDPALPAPRCPELEKWKAQFRERRLIVVYAAPYLGSPASMFGHTFVRLGAGDGGPAPLDPSISFEAATGEDAGGPLVAVKGLLGFYPGVYSLQPYHLKISLYSNLEARDLWEYELSLTPHEVDRMLDHAWELGSTYFDYYFFNANCSYQLLSLVEAARPELRLRERFGAMTIPADTLRALMSVPGLVRRVTRRPSLLARVQERLAAMPSAHARRFAELRDHLERLGPSESLDVLDALLDWNEYRVALESHTLFDPNHRVPLVLLRARATARVADTGESVANGDGVASGGRNGDRSGAGNGASDLPSAPTPAAATPPDQGHPTSRLTVGGGDGRGQGFARLEIRPVLHDLVDADPGYLPGSRLVIGQTALEYQPGAGGAARLEDLTLAEVETLPRWNQLLKPFSWQIGGGLTRPLDTGCVSCLAGSFRAAGGFAGGAGPVTAYALARGDLQGSDTFSPFFRAGPSAEVGALWAIAPFARARFEGSRTWFTGGTTYWRVFGEAQLDLFRSATLQISWERFFAPENAVDPNRLVAGLGWGF